MNNVDPLQKQSLWQLLEKNTNVSNETYPVAPGQYKFGWSSRIFLKASKILNNKSRNVLNNLEFWITVTMTAFWRKYWYLKAIWKLTHFRKQNKHYLCNLQFPLTPESQIHHQRIYFRICLLGLNHTFPYIWEQNLRSLYYRLPVWTQTDTYSTNELYTCGNITEHLPTRTRPNQ